MSENELLINQLKEKINNNFKLTTKDKTIIDKILAYELNYDRLNVITNLIIDIKLDKASLIAFLCYQLYKVCPDEADKLSNNLSKEEKAMVEDYKTVKDINQLTLSEEIEDIRRMFLVMSHDMRVVMIKLAGIYYDISVLNLPLNENQWNFIRQVEEVHMPLAERLGLDQLKQNLYDNVIRLKYPEEYNSLKETVENKREENEQQLKITKAKLQTILNDLKINEEATITKVKNNNLKRRLMDIGFVSGAKVKLILKNIGDNMRAYKIKNTIIALRVNDAKNIIIKES